MDPNLHFGIERDALERACRRMDVRGTAMLAGGVLGILFGLFWLMVAGAVFLLGVGDFWGLLVVAGLCGGAPLIGSAVVLSMGVSRRMLAGRLRELGVLAHPHGSVTVQRVAQWVGGLEGATELLGQACELGVARPRRLP